MPGGVHEDVVSENDPLQPSSNHHLRHNRRKKYLYIGAAVMVATGLITGLVIWVRYGWYGTRPAQPLSMYTADSDHIPIPSVLILIQTFPGMYASRIKEIRETWGKRVVEKSDTLRMYFVSNNSTEGFEDIWLTQCPAGYHQSVCKLGDTLDMAYKYMYESTEGSEMEWLIFGDDDIYLLPDNMQHVILGLGSEARTQRTIFGVLGCGLGLCSGFCGGGMYLMSRMMVHVMATEYDKTRFNTVREEFNATSEFCSGYHDIALGSIALRNRTNVTLTPYPVMPHVYHITPQELNETFYRKNPFTWLYHYPSRENMHFIHNQTIYHRTHLPLGWTTEL